jgi:2-methylcitrate dehydratase PrpD
LNNHSAPEEISPVMNELSSYISSGLEMPVPDDVLEKGKHHLLDTLSAIVSGSQLNPGKLALAYVKKLGGNGNCTVIGSDLLTNPVNAALANGISAHADETDDSHLGGRFHPGCGIVPGAYAAGEYAKASGMDMLKAVILGYDIGTRANLSLGPRKLYAGGHSTHSVGPLFGSAAAAAALMRFTPLQVRHHLSFVIQQASGVQCWVRDQHHCEKAFDFGGMPARNALAAATMIETGFTGVEDALSGYNNFYSAFSTDPRPEELVDGLGSRYEVMQATIKKWCVGSPIQGALDALTTLMKEHSIKASDVEKLIAELPDDRHHIVDNRTMPDICLQHLLSITLIDGTITFETAHDFERMKDPQVLQLRSRIDHIPNAELTKALPPRQVILTIQTKDGRELRHRTHAVKGTPAAPMTRQEVVDKSTDLIAPILGQDRTVALIDAVLDIDRLGDVQELRPLLQA